MKELKASTMVDRIWYQRIVGNKDVIKNNLLTDLKRKAKQADVIFKEEDAVISEVLHKKANCDDRLEVIAIVATRSGYSKRS